MNAKRFIALATILTLILSLGESIGSPARAATAASGPVVIDSHDDFQKCISTADTSGVHVSDAGGGAVELAAQEADDFTETNLDSNKWTSGNWDGSEYTPTLTGDGILSIQSTETNGAWVRSVPTYTHGVMEAVAEFGAAGYQHIGFASDGFSGNRYFIFSTYQGNGDLYARVNNNVAEQNLDLGPLPSGMHRYRIEWSAYDSSTDQVAFYLDGLQVAVFMVTNVWASNFYLYMSNASSTVPLLVDYAQAAPNYVSSGVYTSCAFDTNTYDSSSPDVWNTISLSTDLPTDTQVSVETRTSHDGITWTGWSAPSSGAISNPDRFVQFRLNLSTQDLSVTPLVDSVTLDYQPAMADLGVSQLTSASVIAGTNFYFTIKVQNYGPDTADNVVLKDTLPSGTAFQSLSSPVDWTCTTPVVGGQGIIQCTKSAITSNNVSTFILGVSVNSDVPDNTQISNSVTVSSDTTEPDPDSHANNDSASSTVTRQSDLSISKSADVSYVMPQGEVNYSIAVHNFGPSDASGVTVTDTLPSGSTLVAAPAGTGWDCSATSGQTVTCTLTSLSAGGDAPALNVTIKAPDQIGPLTNTASVASDSAEPDPDPHSNSSTVTIPVELANLKITKTASQPTVLPGGGYSYTLDIVESGDAARGAIVTDALPDGVSYVSYSAPESWDCSHDPVLNKVTCTYDGLLNKNEYSITIYVTAPDQPGLISNTAEISAENAVSQSSQAEVIVQSQVFLPVILK